jgi:hypothetical protein
MKKYTYLHLPVCYQQISGAAYVKPMLVAGQFPAAKDPWVKAEMILKDTYKNSLSSIQKVTVGGKPGIAGKLSTGVTIIIMLYEVGELENDIANAKAQQKNIPQYLSTRYGVKLPSLAKLPQTSDTINEIMTKARLTLNNDEYNAFKQNLAQLDNTLQNNPNKPSTEALNSLQQNLNTLNNSLILRGDSQADIKENMKANINASKQAFKAGEANIKRFVADINQQVKTATQHINGFPKPSAEQKADAEASKAIAPFIDKTLMPFLQDAKNGMQHIGIAKVSKETINGKPVIRIAIGQANNDRYAEKGQFAVFVIGYDKLSVLNSPNALSQLNQFKVPGKGVVFKPFGEATKEGIQITNEPVVPTPLGADPLPGENGSFSRPEPPKTRPAGVETGGQFNHNNTDTGSKRTGATASGTDGPSGAGEPSKAERIEQLYTAINAKEEEIDALEAQRKRIHASTLSNQLLLHRRRAVVRKIAKAKVYAKDASSVAPGQLKIIDEMRRLTLINLQEAKKRREDLKNPPSTLNLEDERQSTIAHHQEYMNDLRTRLNNPNLTPTEREETLAEITREERSLAQFLQSFDRRTTRQFSDINRGINQTNDAIRDNRAMLKLLNDQAVVLANQLLKGKVATQYTNNYRELLKALDADLDAQNDLVNAQREEMLRLSREIQTKLGELTNLQQQYVDLRSGN